MTDIFIQNTDPGAVGAMREWRNPDTGILYVRNMLNTQWLSNGDASLSNLGFLSRDGYSATGELDGTGIQGVTSWSRVDSPDFTTSARVVSVNAATENDLKDFETMFRSYISNSVNTNVSEYSKRSSVVDNICMTFGAIHFPFDGPFPVTPGMIPLPSFIDNTPSLESRTVWIPVATNWMWNFDYSGTMTLEMRTTSDVLVHQDNGNVDYILSNRGYSMSVMYGNGARNGAGTMYLSIGIR